MEKFLQINDGKPYELQDHEDVEQLRQKIADAIADGGVVPVFLDGNPPTVFVNARAVATFSVWQEEKKRSVYETRGLRGV